MKAARYCHKHDGAVQCELCPHGCVMREGQVGLCKVRGVRDGELMALGYGLVSSVHVDPIEKKPLYHFHPGGVVFSIGGWGCNFRCAFCQNWSISQQVMDRGDAYSPEEVARRAGTNGSVGVAYTYNEPVVGYEFVMDCARLVRAAGFTNILVTNGYLNPEPAAELLPWVDALNIDIKSRQDEFYRTQCGGRLAPVLAFAEQAVRAKCHVEITNLVIPGLNDEAQNLEALAQWVAEHLGRRTPLHLSAYRPEYKSRAPPTPLPVLQNALAICRKSLDYVYMGNVMASGGQNTECPGCGHLLIRRLGYSTEVRGIREGVCGACGRKADVIP